MPMKKTAKRIIKALSADGIEVHAQRQIVDLKRLDPMRAFYKKLDFKIRHDDYDVPVRIFFPEEEVFLTTVPGEQKMMVFFHGGGWSTESVDNYERICSRMATATNHIVVSVEYRLAPEYPFPTGLEDCYAAAKAIFQDQFLINVKPENITLIGDSAGGNLAAALSMMARDRGDFCPLRQILIYPALNNDYSEDSPFASVHENGTDYLLTAGKLRDFIDLYASCEEDKENPYFAPLLATDLTDLPRTLILTAEFDPLRDEGEAYGRMLREAGNFVRIHRVKEALHGFFGLGIKSSYVIESLEYIKQFVEEA